MNSKLMTIPEITIRSSIHLIQMDLETKEFYGFGSGCLINHRDKNIILTVAHVVDRGITHLETNQPYVEGQGTPLQRIGGMCHFEALKVKDPEEIREVDDIEKFLQSGKRIDIAFAEIKEFIQLLQPEQDFGAFKIEHGPKVIRSFDHMAEPNRQQEYLFYGKTHQNPIDGRLEMTATFKHGLKYRGVRNDGLYIFTVPKIITDKEDYEGCSGAPILDLEGNIVALAVAIRTDTQILYGVPIQECKRLVDLAMDIKML